MQPYRFNPFELDLLRRLTDKVYLKCDHFNFDRYPSIYFGDFDEVKRLPGFTKTNDLDRLDDFERSKYDTDRLGCYIYNQEKCYIEIYCDRIKDCAVFISVRLGLDFVETRSLLQTIVLLHEMGHWFTHYCLKTNHAQSIEYFKYQTTDIKETVAQLSVIWSTLGLTNARIKRMLEIMDFLTRHQSRPYSQYLKLGKLYTRKLTILNRYVALLDLRNSDLEYLLLNNKTPNPHRLFATLP